MRVRDCPGCVTPANHGRRSGVASGMHFGGGIDNIYAYGYVQLHFSMDKVDEEEF